MKICLITDAWLPQINGVVTTLSHVCDEVTRLGHDVDVISPQQFRTIPCPRYPQIRLALAPGFRLRRRLREWQPEAIHIATEGPLGLAARRWCGRPGNRIPFTTSYHTQFAAYLRKYAGIPTSLTWRGIRWFHGGAERTLVPTESIRRELESHGLANLRVWTRGVETDLFMPHGKNLLDLPRPIFLYAGRVAREKNIGAFLEADLPGSKLVVGDGPALPELRRRHPEVTFVGFKTGLDLAQHYATADVFVFPSRTDTFGIVLIEAMACGLPVAAFPVAGPIDIIEPGVTGVLDEDLSYAAVRALDLDPNVCREKALAFTWQRCAEMFFDNLAPIGTTAKRASQTLAHAG